jgi:hypothetical protein
MRTTELLTIAGREVGQGRPPFIIAEMSGNHNQSLERALEIVEAAAKTGAHALKIQTYTPETMTLDLDEREFHISDPKSLWSGTSLYCRQARPRRRQCAPPPIRAWNAGCRCRVQAGCPAADWDRSAGARVRAASAAPSVAVAARARAVRE